MYGSMTSKLWDTHVQLMQWFPPGRMLETGVLEAWGLIRTALVFYKQHGVVFTCGFT